MEQHLKVRIHENVIPMLTIAFFYYCIFQYCKTYIMEEVKSSDNEECKSKNDIIDIKKITNNLSSSEILQLINKELDIVTNSKQIAFKS